MFKQIIFSLLIADSCYAGAGLVSGTLSPINGSGGSGGLATNGNAGGLTNSVFLSLSRDFGATGTGIETAKLQAALYAARPVLVDTSITSSNVFMTNGSYLIGDGHSFVRMDTNAVGYLFDSFTSPVSNVVMDGVFIDGLSYGIISSQGAFAFDANSTVIQPGANGPNRSAFHVALTNLNSTIRNCSVGNFSQSLIVVDGNNVTFPQPTNNNIRLENNSLYNSWIGYLFTNSAEYVSALNTYGQHIGRVFDIESGNVNISGGVVTRCGTPFYILGQGVNNPAHGIINDIICNHCCVGSICIGFTNGEIITSCEFLSNDTHGGDSAFQFWTNCAGILMANCFFDNLISVSNVGIAPNYLINNIAQGYPTFLGTGAGQVVYKDLHTVYLSTDYETNSATNIFSATVTNINGLSSLLSNTVAPSSLTFPATTVNWTNTNNFNIQIYIDNGTVTGTAIKKNGGTIFSSVTGDATFILQPNETFSETYTIGTPVGKWSPF